MEEADQPWFEDDDRQISAVEPDMDDDFQDEADWDEVFDETHVRQNVVAFPGGRKAAVGAHEPRLETASRKVLRDKARAQGGQFRLPSLNLLSEPTRAGPS